MTPYQLLSEIDKERLRQKARRWYEANRERVRLRHAERREELREYNKQWQQDNRDHVKRRKLERKYADLDKWKAREKDYRQKYRVQRCAAEKRRNIRKRLAPGHHSDEQWQARIAFHGWKCRYCKAVLQPDRITKDHMIPISRGGSNWPSNLVPSCRPCNTRKRSRTLVEFMEEGQFFCNPEIRFTKWEPNGRHNVQV